MKHVFSNPLSATARHLRLVAQQMSGFALTALETWPKAKL